MAKCEILVINVATNEKKPKKILHPNSRKNLKLFEPGNNANPVGGNAHDPLKKELKRAFSGKYMNEIIEIAVMGKQSDLEAIASNPDEPAIRRVLAGALSDAVKNKDWYKIEGIVTRIIGKVPDKVELTKNEELSISVNFKKPKNGN